MTKFPSTFVYRQGRLDHRLLTMDDRRRWTMADRRWTVAAIATIGAAAVMAAQQPRTATPDLTAIATLSGQPSFVSAAGVTRGETEILTLENTSAFENSTQRRVVIVAGLDGDSRG